MGIKNKIQKIMKSKLSDKKVTKQVRIDSGLHRLLKIKSAHGGKTIRELLETCLTDLLSQQNL